MVHPLIPSVLLALVAPAAAMGQVEVAQLTIRERIVIRVPRMPVQPVAAPIAWSEKKGPKCLPIASMAGALISSPTQVDLVLKGGQRVRAKLDGDCTPLDFYSGFYIRPTRDGQVCADRDAIRVRSGASCPIDTFKKLVPRH